MKVLFAVSSESISEAIVKKYQRDYKEILSYKNVYYFNAILKEIQKDKSYDRIVISEDLESFPNNNYDAIDKFIFEKLDDISDEAQDINGNETSIILICTDRRTKGTSFLVKLFSIGIYNALLGSERSMEQVCKLINKPRVKKEAKMYYKIDAEDANYSNKSGEEVSEVEIQNILIHFKKLGKNTDKFADSFNNIASQYTENQLKIIINCLPNNVKAVLQKDCKKYQEIVNANGMALKINDDIGKNIENQKQTGIKIGNIESKNNSSRMSGPIVIPSSVRTSKNKGPAPVRPMGNNIEIPNTEKNENIKNKKIVKRVEEPARNVATRQTRTPENTAKLAAKRERVLENSNEPLKKTRPASINDIVNDSKIENNLVKKANKEKAVRREENNRLSVLEKNPNVNVERKKEIKSDTKAQIKTEVKSEISDTNVNEIKKRGRGRPKKVVTEVEEKVKPKVPSKVNKKEELFDEDDFEEDMMLPGMDDDFEVEDDAEDMLPGVDDDFEAEDDDEDMLPGMEDDFEAEDEEDVLPGMEDDFEAEDDGEDMLPGMDDDFEVEDDEDDNDGILEDMIDDYDDSEEDYTDEVTLPDLDDLDDFEDSNSESMLDNTEDDEIDDMLPGMNDDFEAEDDDNSSLLTDFEEDEDGVSDDNNGYEQYVNNNDNINESNQIESIKPRVDYSMSSLNSLLTRDKKIVTFVGTTKNGTSFLINNLAALFSSLGINTAILDMTKNRNSYYIYTNNEEELRNIAYSSISKLQNGGYAEGIKVNKNLSVYTALPNDGKDYSDAEPILSTLVQNHSLVLIDCDFDTDPSYFASCQEIYLVQSMDILTIQPLTAFLRDLKAQGVLESEKVRVVINKEIKVKSLSTKAIIGGMSFYNDPSMSFMTELFNKDMVKACSMPFEDNAYSKYLDAMVNCNVSINGYSKQFMSKLRNLGDMVYPLVSKSTYGKATPQTDYGKSSFSSNMNNTLNQMRKKY